MSSLWLEPLQAKLYDKRLSPDGKTCHRCGHEVEPVEQCECGINDVLLEEYPKYIEELEALIDRAIEWTVAHVTAPVEPCCKILDDLCKAMEK